MPVPPAKASFIYGALEVTQILNNIELVAQYLQQLQDYAQQLNHYRNMVQNTRYQWGRLLPDDVNSVVSNVAGVVKKGQSISYAMTNHQQVFATKFKDWDAFLAATYGRTEFTTDYKNWTKTTQDSIASALEAAGVQMQNFDNEDAIMRQLEQRAATAEGRNDVMRATGQIAAEQVGQLQKLRQLIASNMQITSSYFAQNNSIDSAGAAASDKAFGMTAPGANPPAVGSGRVYRLGGQ